MSDKLAISSALSVLLMASYVLFGGQARQVDLNAPMLRAPLTAPGAMPQVSEMLRR